MSLTRLYLSAALGTLALVSSNVHAQQNEQQQCLLERLQSADEDVTVAEIKAWCEKSLARVENSTDSEEVVQVDAVEDKPGALTERMRSEQLTEFDPYVLTPHRRNYILPVLTSNNINRRRRCANSGHL